MKLSDLRSAAEIHEQDMLDPEYKREYDRTRLASDVAVRVVAYRAEHGLSQADLARMLDMRQPNIARLESGEHEPSLMTLTRLSSALRMDFSIDIKAGGLRLRKAAPRRSRVTAGVKVKVSPHTGRIVIVPGERQARQRIVPSRSSLAPAARHRRDPS